MKKTNKRQLGVFITSFLLTACVIFFLFSFVTIEKNTGKTLGTIISKPFALDFEDSVATITISDREYLFSVEGINQFTTSKLGALLTVVLLVL